VFEGERDGRRGVRDTALRRDRKDLEPIPFRLGERECGTESDTRAVRQWLIEQILA
jgi:hypothetical protein